MATDVERLVVRLEGRIAHFERAMQRASGSADRNMRRIERRAVTMQGRLNAAFRGVGAVSGFLGRTGIGGGLLGAAGFGLVIREAGQAADAFTEAGNQIRSALAAREIVADVDEIRESLADLAVETRSGFNPTVQLFTRLLRSTVSIQAPISDVIRATEILQKAFQASGATAQEAANGVRQLAQGLASGSLQGDELRSIRENAPVIAQAIADSFGVTIGALKELGSEGRLTAATVFPAILEGGKEIDRQFAVTTATVGKGFGQVGTRVTELIGELDKATGASAGIADSLKDVADAISESTEGAIAFVQTLQRAKEAAEGIVPEGVGFFPQRLIQGDIPDAASLFGPLEGAVRRWQESATRSVNTVFDQFSGPGFTEARDRLNEVREEIASITEELQRQQAAGARSAGGGPFGIGIPITEVGRLRARAAALTEEREKLLDTVIDLGTAPDAPLTAVASGLTAQLEVAQSKVQELEASLISLDDAADIETSIDISVAREGVAANIERIEQELGHLGRDITFDVRPELDVRDVQQLKAELLPLLDPELVQIRAEVFNAPVVEGQLDGIITKIDELRREQIVTIITRLETDRGLPGDIDRLESLLQGVSDQSLIAIQVQLADLASARAELSGLTGDLESAENAGALRPTVDTEELEEARREIGRLQSEIASFGRNAVIKFIAELENGEEILEDFRDIGRTLPLIEISARLENGTQTAEDIRTLRALVPDRPEILTILARFENGQQTRADILDITGLLRDMRRGMADIPGLARDAGSALVQQFGAAGRAIQTALELLERFTGAADRTSTANIRVRGPGLGPDALPGQLENDPSLGINVLRPELREGTEATKGLRRPLDDIASGSERIAGYNQQVASGIPRIGDGIDTIPRDVVSGQRGDFDRVVSAIERVDVTIGSAVARTGASSEGILRGSAFLGQGQTLSGLSGDPVDILESSTLMGRVGSAIAQMLSQFRVNLEVAQLDQVNQRIAAQELRSEFPSASEADLLDLAAARETGSLVADRMEALLRSQEVSNTHLAGIETNTRTFEDRLISLSANEARLARLGAALNPLSGTSSTSGTRTSSTTRVVNANITIQNPGAGVNEPELRQMVRVAANDFARELETARAFR